MQILYCDDCGTRIEDNSDDTGQTRVYCPHCAPKHAAAESTRKPAARESTRNRAARTTPVRPSASGVMRVPGPAARPRTATPNVAGSAASTAQNDTDDFQQKQAPENEPELPAWKSWVLQNKPIAIAGAGVVATILIVLIWMLSGSKGSTPSNKVAIADKNAAQIERDKAAVEKHPPTEGDKATPGESDKAEPKKVEPVKETFNPMMDRAKRKIDELKADIASGKQKPYQLRKRIEELLGPELKNTPMQAEALQLMEKYKSERRPPENPAETIPGVKARVGSGKAQELFDTDFKATSTKTVPTLQYPNDAALLKVFGFKTEVAVKFTGYFEIPKDGAYTFYLNSDDGSILYIGDSILIPNNGLRVNVERDGQIDLKAGKHAFRLEYFQGIGAASLLVSWSGPGLPKQPIPASALSTTP